MHICSSPLPAYWAQRQQALHVQFEDPTESLQALRDLVDLQRATDCGWLQAAAEQVRWQ